MKGKIKEDGKANNEFRQEEENSQVREEGGSSSSSDRMRERMSKRWAKMQISVKMADEGRIQT